MRRLLTACLTVAAAVALMGPASALASGQSAGDQQYIDPLAGSSHPGSSHSKAPTTPAAPTPTPTPAASSTPAAPTTPTAASPSSPSTATPVATTSSKVSTAHDPSGNGLPMTGFNVPLVVLVGACLLASGAYLRRAARRGL